MFNDVFLLQNNDELQVYDYFSRELVYSAKLGDNIEIEPYGEFVVISGELKMNSITKQLYLCDCNDFVCDIEYQKVYEKICINKG